MSRKFAYLLNDRSNPSKTPVWVAPWYRFRACLLKSPNLQTYMEYLDMRAVNVLLLLALLLFPAGAFAQTFPADADWVPVMRDGAPVADIEGDVTGSRDIVGDTTDGAAFVFSDGTYLYFRLRLDEDPRDNSGVALDPFSWGIEFEADGDLNTYEGLVMVDGITKPEEVSVQHNTVQGTIGSPSDQAEVEVGTYPYTTHGRTVVAPTMFSGDADFFLDFAAPWADLAVFGVVPDAPFRLILGSGNSANSFAADIGTSISDSVSDDIACGQAGCVGAPIAVTISNPAAGSATDDTTPTFTGTTEPGATVVIRINPDTPQEELATVTANAQGVWTYTATTALGEGANGFLLTAADPRELLIGVRAVAAGERRAHVPGSSGPPEVRELSESFNRMSDAVTEAADQQRRLIADASHQLRNPMAALRLRMDTLSGQVKPEGVRAYTAGVAEIERLESLLDGLLALAQFEQLRQIDTGAHAHALEHEDEVFGVDVAARARRMRAAADAGQAGIEAGDAKPQGGQCVGQAQAAGNEDIIVQSPGPGTGA